MPNYRCQLVCGDAIECLRAARPAQLVLGSPPYCGKGFRYKGIGRQWNVADWGWWMKDVIDASLTVAPAVVFVVNDPVHKWRYLPAVSWLEGLCYNHGIVADRPLIWSKNAPPNRKDYWSNIYERILVFKREARPVPTFNWEAIGTAMLYKNGGNFSQRDANGRRRAGGKYPVGKLARPKDIIRATVGGGHLGHPLAHENEAPYPESLCEPLILGLTNPGDTVYDPFIGSGTTAATALRLGRRAVGSDLRLSQVRLAARRIKNQFGIKSRIV